MAYASPKGRAFLDRELYLHQEWAEDQARRQEAGVLEEVCFQTKPQLAKVKLQRVLAAGVPFAWVAGDEVYGSNPRLRVWLEQQEVAHVLAVKRNEPLRAVPRQVRAARLVDQVLPEEWVRLNAGDVRRLLNRLALVLVDLVLGWSHWRQRHQAREQRCHYQRRSLNLAQ